MDTECAKRVAAEADWWRDAAYAHLLAVVRWQTLKEMVAGTSAAARFAAAEARSMREFAGFDVQEKRLRRILASAHLS